jgi:hypothetical protein
MHHDAALPEQRSATNIGTSGLVTNSGQTPARSPNGAAGQETACTKTSPQMLCADPYG